MGTIYFAAFLTLLEPLYQPIFPSALNEVLGGTIFLHGPLMLFYVRAQVHDTLPKSFYKQFIVFGLYLWALLISYGIIDLHNDLTEFLVANSIFFCMLTYQLRDFIKKISSRQAQ